MIAALGVLLITGCAPATAPAGFTALDREATAEDVLPEGVVMGPRKGPEIEGIRYFAGRSGDGNTTCISAVVDQTPLNWITGCGGAPNSLREIVTTGLNGVVTVMLVGDNVDTSDFIKDGMQPVHDNVLIAKP
ncbi:hypothetical protein A6A22_09550 [Arthrobacter sp. OY3WO11]|nr:hypothetical protein A6A22_09550 [Arthrobacter sp. OY3WO11]